ncbi:uncharacterized protein G2W53_002364 [Senna tora]|uniref:Uncharacterized protein n=1 Tax=Senna tora TaxID=362788 RepID=A0A835CKA2_9FABA|nr:uncharacterized protein G2W53_002364 [Senna tora]
MFYTLRIPTDIVHLIVIVLGQHRDQILREEHGVIVSHHEPPHIAQTQLEALLHNASNPNRRARPVPAGVLKRRRIRGDSIRRRRLRRRPRLVLQRLPLQPDEPSGDVWLPPELGVAAARVPGIDGAADSKENMGNISGLNFSGGGNDGVAVEEVISACVTVEENNSGASK